MPRSEQVFTVFVASPSDVSPERDRLDEIIQELNVTWSRDLGIRLELIRWEKDAFPAVGSDPQDIINHQLADDYDLFIGIMWCRFGTPTPRASSGTLEEFARAKAKHDRNQNSVDIMMYFKDEPMSPSRLDPEQLRQVLDFRGTLGNEGVLYWNFNGIEQFSNLVRLHLARHLQKWQTRSSKGPEASQRPNVAEVAEPGEPELGLMDYHEILEARFHELTEISNRIAEATAMLGTMISQRATEVTDLARSGNVPAMRKQAPKLLARAAADLAHYTTQINAEVPLFSQAMGTGMNALLGLSSLFGEFGEGAERVSQTETNLDEVMHIRSILAATYESVAGLRESVVGLPPISAELNRAKRDAGVALENLLQEFTSGQALLQEAEGVLSELIVRLKRNE